jgi:hypothetical protein
MLMHNHKTLVLSQQLTTLLFSSYHMQGLECEACKHYMDDSQSHHARSAKDVDESNPRCTGMYIVLGLQLLILIQPVIPAHEFSAYANRLESQHNGHIC